MNRSAHTFFNNPLSLLIKFIFIAVGWVREEVGERQKKMVDINEVEDSEDFTIRPWRRSDSSDSISTDQEKLHKRVSEHNGNVSEMFLFFAYMRLHTLTTP